jgi:hypothetical protein
MRFMFIVRPKGNSGPPPKAFTDALEKAAAEAKQTGALIATGGLAAPATASSVKLSSGKIAVVDGPYAEAKELVGGFAVFELKSKEEAIEQVKHFMELHKTHWPGWEGETEIRQIMGPEDFAANKSGAQAAAHR